MRRAYRDRAQYVADPDFAEVPVERLTAKAHAARLRSTIDPDRASVSATSDLVMPDESDETTHYSVVDASGMAVSVTYTLEAGYGSKIVVPGAGFLLNNEMGDFNGRPGLTTETGLIGTTPNIARPEQRMISSMTPTILARDGRLVAVFGSPGGRTIINTVLQMVLNIVDHGMTIEDAVAAKRLHHQWLPDRISIEAEGATQRKAFAAILKLAGDSLKRPPQGVDPEHPLIGDLKRKDFIAVREFEATETEDEQFVEKINATFKTAKPLMQFLCAALNVAF
jgi:gamma-glutamyltranspeptidase/glutathione hydrolase